MNKILYSLLLFPLICVSQETFILDAENDLYDNIQNLNPPLSTNLISGWNMIGYPCRDTIDLVDGFNLIQDKIIIVKNYLGDAYLPEWNFNGIGELKTGEGYQIKVTQGINGFEFCDYINYPIYDFCNIDSTENIASCIEIENYFNESCFSINDFFQIIEDYNSPITYSIPSGWSMISFNCRQDTIDATTAFEPIIDNIIIVKNYLGDAYLPEWNFDGIGDLTELGGYQIKTIDSVDFSICSNTIIFPTYYGCSDCDAFNYNFYATIDDGSCIPYILGCTDEDSYNYNELANTDDGSCIPFIYGCTNSLAFNYNSEANSDDNSCIPVILGCMDTLAFNYNDIANTDDESCTPFIYGCTDSASYNYNDLANTNDDSCIQFIYGCIDSTAYNYNDVANTDDGSCIPFIYGCTNSLAFNYNSEANSDDGSCNPTCEDGYVLDCDLSGECHPSSWIGDGYSDCLSQEYGADLSCYENDGGDCIGCLDNQACNYDLGASISDSSCTYPETGFNCDGSVNTNDYSYTELYNLGIYPSVITFTGITLYNCDGTGGIGDLCHDFFLRINLPNSTSFETETSDGPNNTGNCSSTHYYNSWDLPINIFYDDLAGETQVRLYDFDNSCSSNYCDLWETLYLYFQDEILENNGGSIYVEDNSDSYINDCSLNLRFYYEISY